jgi:hypothetical protein
MDDTGHWASDTRRPRNRVSHYVRPDGSAECGHAVKADGTPRFLPPVGTPVWEPEGTQHRRCRWCLQMVTGAPVRGKAAGF